MDDTQTELGDDLVFLAIQVRVRIRRNPEWTFHLGAAPGCAHYTLSAYTGHHPAQPPHEWPWQGVVPLSEGIQVMRETLELQVPLVPSMGNSVRGEGEAWEIQFENFGTEVRFRWGNECPPEWSDIERIGRRVLFLVRMRCPGVAGPWNCW